MADNPEQPTNADRLETLQTIAHLEKQLGLEGASDAALKAHCDMLQDIARLTKELDLEGALDDDLCARVDLLEQIAEKQSKAD
jgi:hypothetical protein